MKNIDILNYHHYLQYLDLSNNHLTSLKPLGQLPFLIYLDASNNSLTKILDFKAPFYLTYVNYAYNNLTNLRDLSDFWSLVFMDLAHNSIKKISGLQRLKYLRNLNLAYNEIECIENLNNLNLQILHLKNNQINRCETGVFQSMNRLVKLDVSYNQLSSLKFLHRVNNLQEVNMAENKLDCLMQLNHLRTLGKLIKLDLRGNPVCNKSDYYRVSTNTSLIFFIFCVSWNYFSLQKRLICWVETLFLKAYKLRHYPYSHSKHFYNRTFSTK